MLTFAYTAGSALRETVVLKARSGDAITTHTAADTLTLRVSGGDDTAAIACSASATWVDATAGTVLLALDTTGLAPGDYPLYLAVTAGGVRAEPPPIATLRITAAPGTATAAPTYGTLDDLKLYVGAILDNLADDSDQAGYREQRGQARAWVDRVALGRARAILEDQRRRHAPIVLVDPIVPTDGIDAGPAWGPSIYPDTTLRAQLATIQGHLDADALVVTAAVREAAGRYAAALVLDRQVGMHEPSRTSYQALADAYRARARRLLAATILQLDVDADGVPDYELAPC